MSATVNLSWIEGMSFEAKVNNHTLVLDADEAVGGTDKGPRPKPLMLVSLGGCTGMDVVALLKKMRVEIAGFDLQVDAELTDEHPKIYHRVHLKYIFYGKDLPMDKLEKAVNLSQEKYCGVSAMLKAASHLSFTIEVREPHG